MPFPQPPYNVHVSGVRLNGYVVSGTSFTLENITNGTYTIEVSNEINSNIIINLADCGDWDIGDDIKITATYSEESVSVTHVVSLEDNGYWDVGEMDVVGGIIFDRLINRFTTPYYTENGGNINKLMQVIASHINSVSDVADDIVSAHQLTEATKYSLDQWGNLLQVTRDTGETDDHYRARLLSYSVLYGRSATPQHMISSCADVLGVDTSRIEISDSSSPATFSMSVFLSDIEDAGLLLSEYVDIMNVAKAGGVSLSLLSAGSFECKAIAGGHDATKGYNNIADANPDGGVYAGLIGVV